MLIISAAIGGLNGGKITSMIYSDIPNESFFQYSSEYYIRIILPYEPNRDIALEAMIEVSLDAMPERLQRS